MDVGRIVKVGSSSRIAGCCLEGGRANDMGVDRIVEVGSRA